MAAVTVVLYHDIVDRVSPFESALGITTKPDAFEAHIAWFAQNYDIVDLDTLIDGPHPKRPLLITFDDLFRSSLDAIRAHLVPRDLPSVFLINPTLLGGGSVSLDGLVSWWAETKGLPKLCNRLGVAPVADMGALFSEVLANKTAAARWAIAEDLAGSGGPAPGDLAGRSPVLDAADLAAFGELRIAIGNHTASHVHCRGLAPEEYAAEITDAKTKLEALSGQRVRAFSFPYGHERDATPGALAAIRDCGHEAIFLVHARHNGRRPAPDIWYRVSLHDEAVGQLKTKLSILPRLRSLKARLAGDR